ncbi:hypothetical protein [Acinetobacter pseudolwoffii]|uniref:Uncharacterized protein n=1 Tax=Acinetobacter pseudolwoffii TaxID=2053287 RepID=A0A2H9UQP0_9GAMM|nr:hypothetical protein [Acinetobacter pseudolwoffii]PJI34032.1 hypothetical protein CU320_01475 [Acinetobacter pseudolwoffii]
MDIQKAREAFERRQAKVLNTPYKELKARFDENFRLFGARYNIGSINEKEWNLWLEAWQAKAQAVPEGFVLVKREMQWHKADDLACLEWGRHVGLFCSENRDMSALQVEEFRLRWCKNKANKIMSDYKAMIEAQEPTND